MLWGCDETGSHTPSRVTPLSGTAQKSPPLGFPFYGYPPSMLGAMALAVPGLEVRVGELTCFDALPAHMH